MDEGKVTAVTWDTGCYDCELNSDLCVKNEYEYPRPRGYVTPGFAASCERTGRG